jgi:hypothetical protein
LNSELVRCSICNIESISTEEHVLFCCLLSVYADGTQYDRLHNAQTVRKGWIILVLY